MTTTVTLEHRPRRVPARLISIFLVVVTASAIALAVLVVETHSGAARALKPPTAVATTPALNPHDDPLITRFGRPALDPQNDPLITRFGHAPFNPHDDPLINRYAQP
jgi:hypothetical protein